MRLEPPPWGCPVLSEAGLASPRARQEALAIPCPGPRRGWVQGRRLGVRTGRLSLRRLG